MSFHDIDKHIRNISHDWSTKIEKMILPKALDFENLYLPKLKFPEFDEQEIIQLDSTRDSDTDSTIDVSGYNISIGGNDDITTKQKTKQEKEIKNHRTNMLNKSIKKNIVNNNSNKYSDETQPMKLQQIAIKYSGLSDIAGHDDVKQILRESIIYPTKYPQLFTNGRTVWSRALLYGVPGVGKTALVHAIAAEANLPLYQISSADITSAWFGKTEKLIRELFETLGNQQCLLLIDEVDALCRKSQPSDASHCRRAATELLIQIQNYEDSPMFLICTTNCPWEIDSAFLRRFQQRIYIPLPDFNARKQIILSKIDRTGDIEENPQLNDFVHATEGLTGSDLMNMTRHALMIPLRDLEKATHWTKTECGHVMPCNESEVNAFKSTLTKLPNSKVLCRSLVMSDLWHALKNTDATVTKEDLIPFQKFRAQRKMK